jgi:hypothetical protein
MKSIVICSFTISLLIAGVICSPTAQADPDIGVGVVLTDTAGNIKDSFQVGEEIIVVMSLDNMPDEDEPRIDIPTSAGFSNKKFHLMLQFINPDKELITAINQTGSGDAPPPLSIPIVGTTIILQAEEVEVLEAGWAIKVDPPFNAHDFYNLDKPGKYTVKAVIPMRTYPAAAVQIIKGKKIAELVDKDFEGFIASTSVPFSIEAMPGDYDYDADVDRDDLNMLLAYRNQPATEHPEYDLNGDGMINALDARRLMMMCTRYRCATE